MSRLPETGPSLRRYLTQQKRQANRAGDASPFSRSGGSVTAPEVFTFSGSLVVEGNLEVPNGVIVNDWLEAPLSPGTGSFAETGFGVSPTKVTRAGGVIPVPSGYTQALLFMFVTAGAFNDTAVPDYLIVEAVVDGVGSRDMAQFAAAGRWAVGNTGKAALIPNLGSTISIGVNVWTATETWTADPSSRASCEALAIFLR